MEYLIFLCLGSFGIQVISAQVLRPQPFNILNRPETLIEGNFIPGPSPTVISEPPINSLVPLPSVVSEPSTTIITDCSPTICKNLANTIQLMIVCNLLQNSKGSTELAMQLAAPIINEVMSMPLPCGCVNPFAPTVTPNLITPNVASSNLISNNIVSSNILGSNVVPLTPRVVSPTSNCPNSVLPSVATMPPNIPLASQLSNTNGLLSTLMGLLGNIQG